MDQKSLYRENCEPCPCDDHARSAKAQEAKTEAFCENGIKFNPCYRINACDAKEIMDRCPNYIILDVRSPWEFDEKRIKGAVLIPDYEFPRRAIAELTDKSAHIFVYCERGRRSAVCASWLIRRGYENIYNLGSIHDWPYEVTTKEKM